MNRNAFKTSLFVIFAACAAWKGYVPPNPDRARQGDEMIIYK